jgi:hypothetical protein
VYRLVCLTAVGFAVFGCFVGVPAIWEPDSSSPDELYRFLRNGRAGFIDRSGAIVMQPFLRPSFPQTFAYGTIEGGGGQYLDRSGRLLFDSDRLGINVRGPFSEGLASASKKGSTQVGYIDKLGKFAIPPKFEPPTGWNGVFSEGLASIEAAGRVGYIDRSGSFVIPPTLAAGRSFSGGLAAIVVDGPCSYEIGDARDPCPDLGTWIAPPTAARSGQLPGCRWKFISKTGVAAFPGQYEGTLGFHDGLAAVKLKGKWGFLDSHGALVIPAIYAWATSFSSGLAWVGKGPKDCGYIDKAGRMTLPTCGQSPGPWPPFAEGVVPMRQTNATMIYVDANGRQAVPGVYSWASGFFHGIAHVKLDGPPRGPGKYAYIDHTGRRVFTYDSDVPQF